MPYKNKEDKKARMHDYRIEKKVEDEQRSLAMAEINKYKALDEAGEYAPGEQSSWMDLFKIFNGLDPKLDPEATPKLGAEFINPSQTKFFGNRLMFEEWIEQRRLHRADLWLLMHSARGKWNEQAHRPLSDFFVKKNTTCVLPFEYTQDEKNSWLLQQDAQHERLLLYPRGFRKSTVSILDIVQWIVCCPDIIVLVVASTKILAKLFIGELRGYFAIKDYRRPTPFQMLFPEFCVPEGKGKKSGDVRQFICPMRHLNLKDPTVSYSSMEAGSAGCRADIIRFDDAVDELNYKQVESRRSVLAKFDATLELLVPPFGYWEAVGTRYTDGLRSDSEDGAVSDLYGSILRRNEESDAKSLKILIEPAMSVLPEFEDTPLKQLEPRMVTLLYPDPLGPGSFTELMKKCKKNEIFFRCQQLNQPAAELDDVETYINTFTDENIRAAQRDMSWIHTITGSIRRFLFVDTAMTAGRKSDYSAFVVVQIQERGEGENPLIWFLEVRAEHCNDQRVAEIIAQLMKKWDCGAYVEEISNTGVTFKNEVKRQVYIAGCSHLPFQWFTPDQQPKAKETRIRGLQILHELGLLRFITGPWIDIMMKQLVEYSGHKPKGRSGRKDDIPDAMSYVYKVLPYIEGTMTEEQKKELEAREILSARKAQYDRLFSTPNTNPVQWNRPAEEAQQTNPLYRALDALPKRQGPSLGFGRGKQ